VADDARVQADDDAAAEEQETLRLQSGWRLRRVLITTASFLAVLLFVVFFIHVEGAVGGALFLLTPLYGLTLLLVLRKPRPKRKKARKSLKERLTWQSKVVAALLVFLIVYLPFTFISNRVIPYAPLVEYLLFAGAMFVLYRLIGRSVGVSPSLEALPPPSHRTHRQVVGAIDDPHYQKTVFLNYDYVVKGRGGRGLAHRLERLMEANGVPDERRKAILLPLEEAGGGLVDLSVGRRRQRRQERRQHALDVVIGRMTTELEATG
jgi:hypothetical protein